jgi:hypothetical protein
MLTRKDKQGRPYAALEELKPGSAILLDGGFDCRDAGEATVEADPDGRLFFACKHGRHYLEGQLDDCDGRSLLGVYKAQNGATVEA